MTDVKFKFKKEGFNVVMKQTVEDQVFTPKDILNIIKNLTNEITKAEGQITQIEQQKQQIEKSINNNKNRLKDMQRYETEALAIQRSKAKTLAKEVYLECKTAVETEYKYDPVLDKRGNALQKFALFQRKVGTHKRVAESLAADIIKDNYFNEPIFENPWKSEI